MGGLCTTSSESLPTYTETQTGTEIPGWVSAGGKQLYEQAAHLAQGPYPSYTGPRLATYGGGSKLTAEEQAGAQMLSGPGASDWKSYLDTAFQATQGLGGGYTGMSASELIGGPIDPGAYRSSYGDIVGSRAGMSEADLVGGRAGMSEAELRGGPTVAGEFNLDDSAKEYLDIYQRAADPAIREIDRTTQQRQMDMQAQAARRGAFGGSRAAIQDVTAAYEGAGQAADVRSQAARQGLEFASGQFERDRGARLSASEADRAARFAAENVGQGRFEADRAARFGNEAAQRAAFEADRAARLATSASDRQARFGAEEAMRGRYDLEEASRFQKAGQLGAYAPMLQGLREQEASGKLAVGEAKRQLDQRSLDLAYADYVEQREYPYAMTNFAIGALQGVPYDTRQYSLQQGQQYAQTPSLYGQTISGLGSLYSAYNLLSRG